MMMRAVMLLCLLPWCFMLSGQSLSGYKYKNIVVADSVLLDTMVIVEGSVIIYAADSILAENRDYSINYFSGYLKPSPYFLHQTISVSYKCAGIDLKKPFAHKPRSLQLPVLGPGRYDLGYAPSSPSLSLFKEDGLKLNGSISRGLGFGNNQDIVLNSNLNLQMAGTINNDIDVLAAISDENNPIQPEGNTQQLQDFDRVFIQLHKNKTTLTVGDFEMVRPEGSYFMNYYKKSRGGQINTAVNVGKHGLLKAGGEGALSRGRFARNVINGVEGNQGPYRLSGTNGELFIIIISGTEAVYLDGQKLTRGEQNDYVIDYNSGEITFMARRPVTQYSRIVVEFQFADRNYARSVFHANSAYETAKFKIRLNYFTEQDNKNQPFLQTLNDTTKGILASVGDRINEAVTLSEVKTTFDARKILYKKIDTLGYSNVYVYASQQDDTVFYDVKFSLVGISKGNYRQSISNANGRVFEWVQPIAGVPQGDYEPVILLVSPKRNQMVTVGGELNIIKNTTVNIELANSFNDKNTFSEFDKGNDAGYGIKISAVNISPLSAQSNVTRWMLKTETTYEFVDQNFRYVERYRGVEFDRTWNRMLTNQTAVSDTGYEEHIASFRTSLNKDGVGSFYYQAGLYNRNKLFNGFQNLLGTQIHRGKYHAFAEGELLTTKNRQTSNTINNEVMRYRTELSRNIFKLLAGVRGESEQSTFMLVDDTLRNGSYRYNQFGGFVRNTDSASLKYRMEYNHRIDYLPRGNNFSESTIGRSFTTAADAMQENGNRLSASFTYRQLQVKDTNIISIQPENTILTRIEYDYSFMRRVFTANTYYQVGSGQELRRDFQYLKVLVGQGQYVWKDFNGDGKEQLDEFVLAGLADRPQADYIRVFLPTNSFINTNLNQFNQTLNINPAAVWANKKGVLKVIGKFSNQSAFKIDRKTTELDTRNFLNPFFLNVNDTSLISLQSLFRNTVFFNRSNPVFGADITYQNQRSKTFLTNGFEARNRVEQILNTRWNLSTSWTFNTSFSTGRRIYTSDFFSTNNFDYSFYELKPKLTYQLNTNLRITALFSYFEGRNKAELGSQLSSTREFGTECRYAITKQGVINAKLSYYQVGFNGDVQSTLGYDMLQGLVAGENALWNINFQQRLGSNLQITINYDGRSAETQKTVHIGRMEARYLF